MRKLAVALMLACAGVQLALGDALVASSLALGIRAGDDHAHSLAWRSDGSHLDIVLSHREAGAHAERGTPGDGPLAGVSERDHVVHVLASEAANATPRRALSNASPVLASTLALASVAAPAWLPAHPLEPHSRGVDHLRTIVLRI